MLSPALNTALPTNFWVNTALREVRLEFACTLLAQDALSKIRNNAPILPLPLQKCANP